MAGQIVKLLTDDRWTVKTDITIVTKNPKRGKTVDMTESFVI